MCGIAGLITLDTRQPAEKRRINLEHMISLLGHRGPDNTGRWHDPEIPLSIGHTRLSIIDLSDRGHQPMISASGRYVLSYNGEIYNTDELIKEMGSLMPSLQGRSDTEILLAAIDVWGMASALQKINGMFAFALWDKQQNTLSLVRDRHGQKPLYLGWIDKNTLAFASEAKAFHGHQDFYPEINPDVLALYMRYGYIPAPYSIYKGFITVLPGGVLSIKPEELTPHCVLLPFLQSYWQAGDAIERSKAQSECLSEQGALSQMRSLLYDATKKRMVTDVPLGSFLSGGVDSALITSVMSELSESRVESFTIGFDMEGYDEAAQAREIADYLGTSHNEERLSAQQAMELIPALPEIYDEPFADSSQIPMSLVCLFAKQKITVALTGDGGDEIFGGYQRYISAPALWSKLRYCPAFVRKLMSTALGGLPESFIEKLNPGYPEWRDRLLKLQNGLQAQSADEFYHSLLSKWPDPAELVPKSKELPYPFISEPDPVSEMSMAEKMMFRDSIHYLPNDILTKTDRASMHISLELRSPFLDYRLFELMWRMPENMKIKKRHGKYLATCLLKEHIPENLFNRPKQGFTVPIRPWLKGPLRDWAEEKLQSPSHDLLNQDLVDKTWKEFLNGKDIYFNQIWTVLMFQCWYQKWMR